MFFTEPTSSYRIIQHQMVRAISKIPKNYADIHVSDTERYRHQSWSITHRIVRTLRISSTTILLVLQYSVHISIIVYSFLHSQVQHCKLKNIHLLL